MRARLETVMFLALPLWILSCEEGALNLGTTEAGLARDASETGASSPSVDDPQCDQAPGATISLQDSEALANLLVGGEDWIFCSGDGQNFLGPDQAGIAFASESSGATSFQMLYATANGKVAPGTGPKDRGTVSFHDDGARDAGGRIIYIEFQVDGSSLAAAVVSVLREPVGLGLFLSLSETSFYLATAP